jgi:hypothetical protein
MTTHDALSSYLIYCLILAQGQSNFLVKSMELKCPFRGFPL